MTKRDKRLLMFLFLFMIIAGFTIFIFLPKIKVIGDLNGKILDATIQKEQILEKTEGLSQLEVTLSEKETELMILKEQFYPILNTQDIDNLLTQKALAQGLSIRLLVIEQLEAPVTLEYYIGYGKVKEDSKEEETSTLGGALNELSEELDEIAGQDLENEDSKTFEDTIYQSRISLTVEGDSFGIQRLIDELFDEPSMLVTGWQRTKDGLEEGQEITMINLTIFMGDLE